jgi:membrane protease YdiL (CAAX protease family)
LFVLAVSLWGTANRAWTELGFRFELNDYAVTGAVLTAAGITFLVMQLRQVATASNAQIQRIKSAFGELALLVPQNGSELAAFNVLSLTAGIVEETLWRGFLFWYLGHVMPLWLAALVSAIGFGIAHGYQGVANIPRVILVGAVFSGLYSLTGSLLMSIVLHAAVDLLQGRLAYEVLRRNA